MNLAELKEGQRAVLTDIGGEGALRQHFLDMGLIPGTVVTYVKAAPMGDPIEYRIWDYELTLRLSEAKQIRITKVEADKQKEQKQKESRNTKASLHPGLGEMGIYHVKQRGETIEKGELLTFGLAGNQNCGKTTLFNQLTGSNQHVGNFPGVTVDRTDGIIIGHKNVTITDLPGIYSLSPYSSEEIVTRDFILREKPDGLINIVDATNIERNLLLTMQLIELDVPMVIALNMMDEVTESGGSIDINALESVLGVPVVPISALKNQGIDELVEHIINVAKFSEYPSRLDFCPDNGGKESAVHRCIHALIHLIEDHAKAANIPVRFAASKLAEGDSLIVEQLQLDQNEKDMVEHIIQQMEKERGLDRAAAIADMRFAFISKICQETVVKPRESKEHIRSTNLDKILTGKYTAIPAFIGIMSLVFSNACLLLPS